MKRLTLYQRLKPEVKNQLQENYGEFEHSIKIIFKSLHEEEHYNALTINQVNNLILFTNYLKLEIMEDKIYCPWAVAYEVCKDHYTQEEIDDMLFCEVKELILDYEKD
jgi:hypothetical protein